MVNKNATVYLTDTLIYNYDSLTVSRVKGEEVFVTLTVVVVNGDGLTQEQSVEIALLEEEDGWRINSPTYAKYFDRQQYDDLQNNNIK